MQLLLFIHTKYVKLIQGFIFPHVLLNSKTTFCSLERSFSLSFLHRGSSQEHFVSEAFNEKSEESNKKA